MTTKREAALSALAALLNAVARVERNPVAALPSAIPTGGLIVLRDGDPGDPDVVLSPLRYTYDHATQVEVYVPPSSAGGGDPARDALLAAIGAALEADPLLGGAVDGAVPSAPLVLHGAPGGGAPVAAVLAVTLTYTTSSPLA